MKKKPGRPAAVLALIAVVYFALTGVASASFAEPRHERCATRDQRSGRRKSRAPASSQTNSSIVGLIAAKPSTEFSDKLHLFGQFVGDWEFDLVQLAPDGAKRFGKGEWHFGWILEGRAIQDVWIARFSDAKPGDPPEGHGTTIRIYNPTLDAWQIVWVSAARRDVQTFTARKVGDEIVLEARPENATERGRWVFSNIKKDSFDWRAVESEDDGKTWRLMQEMHVRRVGAPK